MLSLLLVSKNNLDNFLVKWIFFYYFLMYMYFFWFGHLKSSRKVEICITAVYIIQHRYSAVTVRKLKIWVLCLSNTIIIPRLYCEATIEESCSQSHVPTFYCIL